MRDCEFEFIRTLVYERSRISLGPDQRELITARLGRRPRATPMATWGDNCRLLQSPPAEDEPANLIDVISTNPTFFRERTHFDFLCTRAAPQFAGGKNRPSRFDVWSTASCPPLATNTAHP